MDFFYEPADVRDSGSLYESGGYLPEHQPLACRPFSPYLLGVVEALSARVIVSGFNARWVFQRGILGIAVCFVILLGGWERVCCVDYLSSRIE